MKRPVWNEEMRRILAKQYAQYLADWGANKDSEEIEEDCFKIFEWHVNDNAYGLAKEFEEEGYEPDLDFVEMMHSVSSDARDILYEFIEKWVSENNIMPDFVYGDNVIAEIRNKQQKGEITGIKSKYAEYTIFAEGIEEKKTNCGFVIAYEKVSKCESA